MVTQVFRQYQDKSSLKRKNSRYVQGGKSYMLDATRLGWWERNRNIVFGNVDDISIDINNTNQFRADIMSIAIYGTSDYEWLILEYNSIVDIKEELIIGRRIYAPSFERVATRIAVNQA